MKPNQANTVISKLQKNNLLFSSHSVFSFWLWQHEQTNIFYLCPLVSIDIPTNFQVCLFLPKTASCFSCTTLSLKETEWKEQITTDLRLRLCQGSQARQVFFFFFCDFQFVCYLHNCVQLFATPWTVAHQSPLSMEFPRQEYWSGQPFPSLGDLPDPGIKFRSPALQADSLPSEPLGNPQFIHL